MYARKYYLIIYNNKLYYIQQQNICNSSFREYSLFHFHLFTF